MNVKQANSISTSLGRPTLCVHLAVKHDFHAFGSLAWELSENVAA
jgi:hypothetical protein